MTEQTEQPLLVKKPRQQRKKKAEAPKAPEQTIVDGVLCHKEGDTWVPYTAAELTGMVQGLSQLAQQLAQKADQSYNEGVAVTQRNLRVRLGLDVRGVDS